MNMGPILGVLGPVFFEVVDLCESHGLILSEWLREFAIALNFSRTVKIV